MSAATTSASCLDDEIFRSALGHNAVLLLAVPVLLVGSTILAALLHERLPGWQVHRFLLFMPYVLAIPVVGAVFNYLFEFNGGLNQALRGLGLGFRRRTGWATRRPRWS